MLIPRFLQQGDKVAIVATARKITLAELEPAIALLRLWGLEVVIGNSIDNAHHQFADTDTARAADLQQCLNNPDIRAIWCARGGYGTARILDQIDWQIFSQSPKWLIGYSDITALHSHVQRHLATCTIHATMPINVATNDTEALLTLRQALFGEPLRYEQLPNHPLNTQGYAKAKIVGGNLSVLYSLIGTPSALESRGKILFLEDLDEYLYHIDRMMLCLYRSGFLSELSGLIVGGMTEMKDNAVPFGKDAYQIIADYAHLYNYPVLFNFPAGHISDNRAIILGSDCLLDVNKYGASVEICYSRVN